jgi:hypothetical protein
VLVCSIFWREMTTRGALAGGTLGLVSALALTVLSKSVWVDVLHHARAPVLLDNPALVSVPLAFAGIWLVSLLDRGARAAHERRRVRDAGVLRADRRDRGSSGSALNTSPTGRGAAARCSRTRRRTASAISPRSRRYRVDEAAIAPAAVSAIGGHLTILDIGARGIGYIAGFAMNLFARCGDVTDGAILHDNADRTRAIAHRIPFATAPFSSSHA